MTHVPEGPLPTEVPDLLDPGDETQRNFRYQHAYGVILLAGAASGGLPYVALWCEQHEDFLAERDSGQYDAYQIKTSTPENGPWVWTTDELKGSLKRFVRLDRRFPGRLQQFNFVSNAAALDSHASAQVGRSPARLLEALNSDLSPPLAAALRTLTDYCECDEGTMRSVLQRLELKKGPGRDSFHDEIAHTHLSSWPVCMPMSAAQRNRCLEILIGLVYRACSLVIDDPAKHWCCVTGEHAADPELRAKRIGVDTVAALLSELEACPFKYARTDPLPVLGTGAAKSVLQRKLLQGGLAEYLGLMKSRTLSAERMLIERTHAAPAETAELLTQLSAVVKAECDEVRLDVSQRSEIYGPAMLSQVHGRLRRLAEKSPAMVHHQRYELLAGIAGLLTEDCHVWWSPRFDLGEKP